MKLTKQKIEKLAADIEAFLVENDMAEYASIYYNNQVDRYCCDKNSPCWLVLSGVDPHDYFEYAAYEHILSMSFDGPLYSFLNYDGSRKLIDEFYAIFDKYGLYFEFGHSWNLTCCTKDEDTEVEYTYYELPEETIRLYINDIIPFELELIMHDWYNMSRDVGDQGSCVLGAGFRFRYDGKKYFMPAQSPWQGSISWEIPKDKIREELEKIGATEIVYEWGNMD